MFIAQLITKVREAVKFLLNFYFQSLTITVLLGIQVQ